MPELIEIEGELARIVERKIVREVPLADLIPHIETRLPVTTPALPDRTRMFHLDPSNNDRWTLSILIEIAPQVRTLSFALGGWGEGNEVGATHRLALPYTIFGFHLVSTTKGRTWSFEDYDCLFSKEPITRGDQWMIPALLPNVFQNGRICFGNTAPNIRGDAPLADRLNAIVNEWYLTNFTNQGHTRPGFLPWHGRRSFAKWVRETNANPRCWENWPEFDEADTTQEHLTVDHVLGQFHTRPPRTTRIDLPDGIPDLAFNPTFGRAEQWFDQLNTTQRRRLVTAIDNWRRDHNLDEATPETEPAMTPDEEEDEDA